MIAKADIRGVQEWMGHADVQTTMKYLHYVPRDDDAALVAEAFRAEPVGTRVKAKGLMTRSAAGTGPSRASAKASATRGP